MTENSVMVQVQHGVYQKTLADSIDGTKGSLSVSMTLPTGSGFQVNLVKSSQDLNTILAQSAQFNITSAGGSSSVVVSTGSGTGSSTAVSSGVGSSTGPAASGTSASLAYGSFYAAQFSRC
jgi:Kre9/KNH-like N-terminal Ig-like domain